MNGVKLSTDRGQCCALSVFGVFSGVAGWVKDVEFYFAGFAVIDAVSTGIIVEIRALKPGDGNANLFEVGRR